jgi:hypothetical protein
MVFGLDCSSDCGSLEAPRGAPLSGAVFMGRIRRGSRIRRHAFGERRRRDVRTLETGLGRRRSWVREKQRRLVNPRGNYLEVVLLRLNGNRLVVRPAQPGPWVRKVRHALGANTGGVCEQSRCTCVARVERTGELRPDPVRPLRRDMVRDDRSRRHQPALPATRRDRVDETSEGAVAARATSGKWQASR